MFFRGARIQQDEQARSTFLSPETRSNVCAKLPSAAGVSPVHFRIADSLQRTFSEFTNMSERNAPLEVAIPVMRARRGALLPETLAGSPIASRFRTTWSVGELPLLVASGSSTVRKPCSRRNATRHHLGGSDMAQKDSRRTAASA
jgi:hypothetical protein